MYTIKFHDATQAALYAHRENVAFMKKARRLAREAKAKAKHRLTRVNRTTYILGS